MRLRRSDTENWCWLYANSKHRFMTPCFLQEKCQNNLYSGPIGLSCCLRLCDRLNYWRFLQSPPNKVCSVPEDWSSGKLSVPEDWFWKLFGSTEKTDFTDKLLVLDSRLTLETVQSQKTRRDWLGKLPGDWVSRRRLTWETVQCWKSDLGNLVHSQKPTDLGKRSRPGQPAKDRDLGNCSVPEDWGGKPLFSPRRLTSETVQSQQSDLGNCSVPEYWLGKMFSPRLVCIGKMFSLRLKSVLGNGSLAED